MFKQKLTKMTAGSNALSDYKLTISKSRWKHLFPELDKDLDEELRKSYRRGVYLFKSGLQRSKRGKCCKFRRKQFISFTNVYAKNACSENLCFLNGKYKHDKIYDLYIQALTCSFKIKPNKIPTIQVKKSRTFLPNEYILDSGDEPVPLMLTSVDLKLFLEQYDVYDLTYDYGWKFKSMQGLFTEYIHKWITKKINASLEKNEGMRTIAKFMLNNLYRKICNFYKIYCKKSIFG